jgi:hypothetical protein
MQVESVLAGGLIVKARARQPKQLTLACDTDGRMIPLDALPKAFN